MTDIAEPDGVIEVVQIQPSLIGERLQFFHRKRNKICVHGDESGDKIPHLPEVAPVVVAVGGGFKSRIDVGIRECPVTDVAVRRADRSLAADFDVVTVECEHQIAPDDQVLLRPRSVPDRAHVIGRLQVGEADVSVLPAEARMNDRYFAVERSASQLSPTICGRVVQHEVPGRIPYLLCGKAVAGKCLDRITLDPPQDIAVRHVQVECAERETSVETTHAFTAHDQLGKSRRVTVAVSEPAPG